MEWSRHVCNAGLLSWIIHDDYERDHLIRIIAARNHTATTQSTNCPILQDDCYCYCCRESGDEGLWKVNEHAGPKAIIERVDEIQNNCSTHLVLILIFFENRENNLKMVEKQRNENSARSQEEDVIMSMSMFIMEKCLANKLPHRLIENPTGGYPQYHTKYVHVHSSFVYKQLACKWIRIRPERKMH